MATGDTYAFDPGISREGRPRLLAASGESLLCRGARRTRSLGTYILKPNQPGLGSHVANAAFMVAPNARGLGVGQALGEHCVDEARRLGFRAMQFNFVVSTNESAVRLWRRLGFEIVGHAAGRVPSFPERGYVDAYVMYRSLSAD